MASNELQECTCPLFFLFGKGRKLIMTSLLTCRICRCPTVAKRAAVVAAAYVVESRAAIFWCVCVPVCWVGVNVLPAWAIVLSPHCIVIRVAVTAGAVIPIVILPCRRKRGSCQDNFELSVHWLFGSS